MLVTITRSESPKSWYANRIGESWHVLSSVKGRHCIDIRHYPDMKFLKGFYIRVEDCAIPQQEPQKEKEEEVYRFMCANCDYVFTSTVDTELNCKWCKTRIKTDPFSEADGMWDFWTTSLV